MNIKIAVIGSTDFCNRAQQLVSDRQDIELIFYCYEEPQQAPQLISSLTPCDAIFFSGSLPYFYSKKVLATIPIPSTYLKQDAIEIATTLLHLSLLGPIDLSRISIDVREMASIEHVLNDLQQTAKPPFIHLLQDDETIPTIATFHEQLALQQKTDMAITSVHAVYEQLQQQNVPAMKMIDPESSILRTIEHAKQQAILHKSNSAQIAVGIVKKTDALHSFDSTIEKIAAVLQASWNEQDGIFTLFTTMGNIESSLTNEDFLSLFHSFTNAGKMAFGCGETIVDATQNAYFALNLIQQNDDHSFYMLDRHKKLHGPFPQSNEAIDMRVNNPLLVEMAEKTKLSPANISKLATFSKARQAKQFTANDLALHLNVTRRTAERTLKKLVEFHYANIVGEEMAYRQGRPRALYELDFPIYH